MAVLESISAHRVTLPLRNPFETARRRRTTAENVRVEARLKDGAVGYGEASPADYVTGEDAGSLLSSVNEVAPLLAGRDVACHAEWIRWLYEMLPDRPSARSAVEMALLDALCRQAGIPLYRYFGGFCTEVRTDLTIPICDAAAAEKLAVEAAGRGFRSLKIKVGVAEPGADLERVAAVQRGAPDAGIRLDANQAFDAVGALEFITACLNRGVRLELMEQPTAAADLAALGAVTRGSSVPVFADEAVLSPAHAARIAGEGLAHGINIKVAKSGLSGALEIITIARAAGLRLMLGCMLESLPGIGASVHLACGAGAFDFVDLDGHMLIGIEAEGSPFSQREDLLTVAGCGPGLDWSPKEARGICPQGCNALS